MGYYTNAKRCTEGGVPIKRPKWWGELGNDPEYLAAVAPRNTFKAAYYEGGHRVTMWDGVPCRVAAIVKTWTPWRRRLLVSAPPGDKYLKESAAQFERLMAG